jgi:hypothetical protein
VTNCVHQISLLEECERCPAWTGESAYRSFAGPMANSMPYETLDSFNRRFYQGVARRWNVPQHPEGGLEPVQKRQKHE